MNTSYCTNTKCSVDCIRNQSNIPTIVVNGITVKDTGGAFIPVLDWWKDCPWNPRGLEDMILGGRYGF